MAVVVTDLGTAGDNSSASFAITTLAATAAGSFIAVIVDEFGFTPIGAVTDSAGNTYTLIETLLPAVGGYGGLWYAYNCLALGSGATITYTKQASGDNCAMSALSATGLLTTNPIDTAVSAKATGTSTTPSVTSGTPGQSGELFLGFMLSRGNTLGVYTPDVNWPAPFTAKSQAASFVGGGNIVNSGTGTKTFSPTISNSVGWAAAIYGFKAVASAATGSRLASLGVGH